MGFLDSYNGFLKNCNRFFDERNGSKKHHKNKADRKTKNSKEKIKKNQTYIEDEEEDTVDENAVAAAQVIGAYINHHR